jgi:hypothetical protein
MLLHRRQACIDNSRQKQRAKTTIVSVIANKELTFLRCSA